MLPIIVLTRDRRVRLLMWCTDSPVELKSALISDQRMMKELIKQTEGWY